MPTSIHLPPSLLAAVDRCARQRRMTRNAFITHVLEEKVANTAEWTPGFFESLLDVAPEVREAADEFIASIEVARTSKKAPPF